MLTDEPKISNSELERRMAHLAWNSVAARWISAAGPLPPTGHSTADRIGELRGARLPNPAWTRLRDWQNPGTFWATTLG